MISAIEVDALTAPPDVDIALPGSKSITNRVLVAAALAEGTSTIDGVLVAEDTRAMIDCLRGLGAGIDLDETTARAVVTGTAGRLAAEPGVTLAVRQSGTTARFVLPLAALSATPVLVDGDDQIRRRPQGELLDALERLGAAFRCDGAEATLPVSFRPAALRGGPIEVSAAVSSQFVSGLLLVAPLLPGGLDITLTGDPRTGEIVSAPYLRMTLAAMARFGVRADVVDDRRFVVGPGGYRAADLRVEPDASTASYFFAAAAVSGGRVAVEGLGISSVQGDRGFVDVLAAMGATVHSTADRTEVRGPAVLTGITVSMRDMSDTAPTLGAIAPLAAGPVVVDEIGFIRHKESDRIAAVVTELSRLGVDATATDDGFRVEPGVVHGGTVETYDDHRIAMAFTVLGLVVPGITIANPQCVAKTFPTFFDAVDALRAEGDRSLAVLAIDGPAGAGKSTVSRAVAQRLGLEVLDTGAMYRSVAYAALTRGLDPGDGDAVAELARHLEIDIGSDRILVDGIDVTTDIRTEPVNATVSLIAANPGVRASLRRQQRAWARRRGGGVLEGRDIASVVFPNARLKVFVTAAPEERARRRAAESGEPYEEILAAIARRDLLDSGRSDSPLREVGDARVLDTTEMSIDEVVDTVVAAFR